MAATVTNRAKQRLATGTLVPGTTDLRMGLLGTQALTGTEHTAVSDLNSVADLLAVAGVDELTGVASYSRVALTGEAATEDDANNRSNIDADTVDFGDLETGDTIWGAFIFVEGASDAARDLIAVYDLAETPTNGGGITVPITDFLRVT